MEGPFKHGMIAIEDNTKPGVWISELIGSVNLVFVVQLVGFRRLWFDLVHVSGWFGSETSVSIGNKYLMR